MGAGSEAARARRASAARHRRWRTRLLESRRRGLAENARAALLGAQDRERDRQVAEEPAAEGPHLLSIYSGLCDLAADDKTQARDHKTTPPPFI